MNADERRGASGAAAGAGVASRGPGSEVRPRGARPEANPAPGTGPLGASGPRPRSDRWWLKMLAASAALAAVLLGAYFLTPAALLHYHAWKWRKSRPDRDRHLASATRLVVAQELHREAIVRLLGQPNGTNGRNLLYFPPDILEWFPSGLVSEPVTVEVVPPEVPPSRRVVIRSPDGRSVRQFGPVDFHCHEIVIESGRAAAVRKVRCRFAAGAGGAARTGRP